MTDFFEYKSASSTSAMINVGLILNEHSDSTTMIPLARSSPGPADFFGNKIPKLEFDKNAAPIVVPKENLCRKVAVKRRHYFESGRLTYYDGMEMYCIDDTTHVISSEYKNLFALSDAIILSSDSNDGKFMSIYFEKCDIIRICRSAISKSKGLDHVLIQIPKVSDEIMSVGIVQLVTNRFI